MSGAADWTSTLIAVQARQAGLHALARDSSVSLG
jgi:hypothetical protein